MAGDSGTTRPWQLWRMSAVKWSDVSDLVEGEKDWVWTRVAVTTCIECGDGTWVVTWVCEFLMRCTDVDGEHYPFFFF